MSNDNQTLKKAQQLAIKDSIMLLSSYPLLGSIISMLDKRFTKQVPTLGVSYSNKKNHWELAINPEFYVGLENEDKRYAVLLHEAWHVMLLHPIRMGKITRIKNIAADIVTNDIISFTSPTTNRSVTMREILPEGCFYDTFGLEKIEDDCYEKVLERLNKLAQQQQQMQKKMSQTGNGNGETIDSHDWEPKDGDEEANGEKKSLASAKENADMELRELINTAITSNPKDFGNLPANIQKYITQALRPQVKWNKLLRIHGQNAVKYGHYYTVKKISRRYGYPYPGRRKRKGGLVVAAVDVSGSVSEEYKKQFLGELKGMSNYVDLYIITFDTRVVDSYAGYNKQLKLSDTCGGTDPNCVFEECLKIKPDKVVILTDGYFGSLDTKGFDTLFVLTPDGEERKEGKCVRIS